MRLFYIQFQTEIFQQLWKNCQKHECIDNIVYFSL